MLGNKLSKRNSIAVVIIFNARLRRACNCWHNGTVIQIDEKYHFIYSNGKLGEEVAASYNNETAKLVEIKSTGTANTISGIPDNVVIFMSSTDADQISNRVK